MTLCTEDSGKVVDVMGVGDVMEVMEVVFGFNFGLTVPA
jgi:hypothetical protein